MFYSIYQVRQSTLQHKYDRLHAAYQLLSSKIKYFSQNVHLKQFVDENVQGKFKSTNLRRRTSGFGANALVSTQLTPLHDAIGDTTKQTDIDRQSKETSGNASEEPIQNKELAEPLNKEDSSAFTVQKVKDSSPHNWKDPFQVSTNFEIAFS